MPLFVTASHISCLMAEHSPSHTLAMMASLLGGEIGPSDQRDLGQHLGESSTDTSPSNLLNVSDVRVTDDEQVEDIVDVPETAMGKKRKRDKKQEQAEE